MLRPNLTRDNIVSLLTKRGITVPKTPFLFGHRPEASVNGINRYDDAIALLRPASIETFNANTDPSRHEPRMATLAPGVYSYMVGTHNRTKDKSKQYQALVQALPVTVNRWPDNDPKTPETETGYFGINIHRGGFTTTGSAGCQTIHPDQWNEFIIAVKNAMLAAHVATIPYVLAEGD